MESKYTIVDFTYPEIEPLAVRESNLVGVFGLPKVAPPESPAELVRRALADPLGAPRLSQLAGDKKNIVILCDDHTRTTPVRQILPLVLDELAAAGATVDDITVLLGLGTHRAMTAAEMMVKLGQDVVGTYPVVNHDWRARSELVDLGRTPSGIPVLVNRLAVEADLLIGLGHVVPHRVAGYSGGGKIVQPGVCGGDTTGQTHWLSSLTRFDRIFGKRDNPVRKEIDAIARRVGLDFIVNTVQNGDGDLVGVFAGDMEMAHRRACALAEKVCGVSIPEHADIVVVEAYPADADVWQAVKALFPAALVVEPGGVIILVSPCREGVSDQHPELLEIGYRPPLEIRSMVASRAIHDLSAAAHLAHVSEIVTGWACTFFVTPGVGREHASRLNVLWADSAQNALEWSMKVIGCSARVCVLRNGAEILPIVCAR